MDREDFLRECRLLASIQHQNVARLVGVCTTEQPYCSVLEHSLIGDLYGYLRKSSEENPTALGFPQMLDFVCQIVSGMKHLESRNIVHKDLAARNCIISNNGVIKISDVAMGMSEFEFDYADARGNSKAPIRWQPWESILLGRVSLSSNVWSFGVTSWEIFGLCKERPFSMLTDSEVVQNAERIYYNDNLQVKLKRIKFCFTFGRSLVGAKMH